MILNEFGIELVVGKALPSINEWPSNPTLEQSRAKFRLRMVENPYQRTPCSIICVVAVYLEVRQRIGSQEHVSFCREFAEELGLQEGVRYTEC